MRKLLVGFIALAIVGVAAIASATAGSGSPRTDDRELTVRRFAIAIPADGLFWTTFESFPEFAG